MTIAGCSFLTLFKVHNATFFPGWYKQTVNDPTASLSAERRGTISLPDVESSFSKSRMQYTHKVRWGERANAEYLATDESSCNSGDDSCIEQRCARL
jgi:hypothetical protein